MENTKNLLYSLYAAAAVLGGSMLSGCVTRTVYVYPDGRPVYRPTATYTTTPSYNSGSSSAGQALSGILMGIGQGLSAL